MTSRKIEDAIFWMWNNHQRHIWPMRGDQFPCIIEVERLHLVEVRTPVSFRRIMGFPTTDGLYPVQVAEWATGAKCPSCWNDISRPRSETGVIECLIDSRFMHHLHRIKYEADLERKRLQSELPINPMYRKHLVDSAGAVLGIVHMAQCACDTIMWARVKEKSPRPIALKMVTIEPPQTLANNIALVSDDGPFAA